MKTTHAQRLICTGLIFFAAATALSSPVTFRVENYLVTNTDTMDVRGSFNGWNPGYNLVPSDNPNIWTNTFEISDTPGTIEYYKFTWNSNWELPNMGNRPFTLTGSPQILPLVYFNDLPPDASATTNSVTFRVSMATQVTLGNFDPNTDTVSAAGTFQRPGQWVPVAFQLTNNGANVYIGTYTNDGNYEGTYEEFKFIYTRFGGDNWETNNNRSYFLTNQQVLPIVYFNDLGHASSVTFKVDLSVQAAAGRFITGSEIVECKGTFNDWRGGFILTNDFAAPNPNLYSGTTYVFGNPGTAEEYRFTVNDGLSGLGWETPATTGGYNRSFIQTVGAQTLSHVLWSDWTAADLLPAGIVVTFTVNMTNATGTDGHPFNPADPDFDTVYLNGDWIPWLNWDTNSLSPFMMTNNPPGSKLYTFSLILPQGYAVPLTYKYSINGFDNEAGYGTNHLRYVRTVGNYSLPLDTFGNQLHEPSFGNLKIGPATGGLSPISWLGRPGVHLQSATNLTGSILWQNLPATDGLSFTNFAVSGPKQFFRLFKP